MWIPIPSTTCDVISINGQGQTFQLTCEEYRDLSNHTCTRMSKIWSRRQEKKQKTLQFDAKIPMKILLLSPLPVPPSYKPSQKHFLPNCSLLKYNAQQKKNNSRKHKRREGEKAKRKSQDCCVTFKPKKPHIS